MCLPHNRSPLMGHDLTSGQPSGLSITNLLFALITPCSSQSDLLEALIDNHTLLHLDLSGNLLLGPEGASCLAGALSSRTCIPARSSPLTMVLSSCDIGFQGMNRCHAGSSIRMNILILELIIYSCYSSPCLLCRLRLQGSCGYAGQVSRGSR